MYEKVIGQRVQHQRGSEHNFAYRHRGWSAIANVRNPCDNRCTHSASRVDYGA